MAVEHSSLPTPSQMPSSLFVSHEGESIRFRMRPCLERVRLQPFVRAGGGMLNNSIADSQTIQVVPPGHLTLEEKAISSFYLWACIRAKRMVSMAKYQVPKNTEAPTEEPTSDDVASSTSSRRTRGRNIFTSGDDEKIVNFLKKVKKREFHSNTDMFRRMSQEFGQYHTWESLKNRVRRQIIPKLPKMLDADDLKRVSSLLNIDSDSSSSSSSSSDSSKSSSEDSSGTTTDSGDGLPLKRSIANLPKCLAKYLAFGETLRWTHSQSTILLWMTSGDIDAAKTMMQTKDCSSLLWTPTMDEQLTSGDRQMTSAIFEELGEKEMLERFRFLEDCDDDDKEVEDFMIT